MCPCVHVSMCPCVRVSVCVPVCVCVCVRVCVFSTHSSSPSPHPTPPTSECRLTPWLHVLPTTGSKTSGVRRVTLGGRLGRPLLCSSGHAHLLKGNWWWLSKGSPSSLSMVESMLQEVRHLEGRGEGRGGWRGEMKRGDEGMGKEARGGIRRGE